MYEPCRIYNTSLFPFCQDESSYPSLCCNYAAYILYKPMLSLFAQLPPPLFHILVFFFGIKKRPFQSLARILYHSTIDNVNIFFIVPLFEYTLLQKPLRIFILYNGFKINFISQQTPRQRLPTVLQSQNLQ